MSARNSTTLIQIEDQAIKLGWYKQHPKVCFCSYVAKETGEDGNENPSNKAIAFALDLLEKLK